MSYYFDSSEKIHHKLYLIFFLSAKYLTTVMILNMTSVVFSIFVIRIYHKRSSTTSEEFNSNKSADTTRRNSITPLDNGPSISENISGNTKLGSLKKEPSGQWTKRQYPLSYCLQLTANLEHIDKMLFCLMVFSNALCLLIFILIPLM